MVEHGPQNQTKEPRIYAADRRLCGVSQVPAEYFEQLTGDKKGAKRLARRREFIAAGAAVESSGRALVTHGLETGKAWAIVCGTGMSIIGAMGQTNLKNRNGAEVSMILIEKIGKLGAHKSAISEILDESHIPPDEISRLSMLPVDAYNSEFKGAKLKAITDAVTPLLCGGAMGLDGNYLPAGALGAAGIFSAPTGRLIYNEHFQRSAAKRMAQAALHMPFLRSVYKDHVRMTDRMNGLTHLSDGLILGLALTGEEVSAAAIYAGLHGSKGYRDILYAQKDKEETERTSMIAIRLMEALSSAPFIATPQRWKEHVQAAKGIDVFQEALPFTDGIVIKDFSAQLPSGEATNLPPLNLEIPAKGAAILRASSGSGKSVTLMGIMHLYEHTGSVHLVKESVLKDVHSFPDRESIDDEILLITKDRLDKNDRIVDLFKTSFKEAHLDLYNTHLKKYKGKKNRMFVELAWSTADNLLEEDVKKHEEKRQTVFPYQMFKDLAELREKRNEWVNGHIQEREGNLKRIKAEKRTFKNLSDGQERSMMTLLAKVAAQVKKRVLIILDEPLAGLDKKQKEQQIKELREIQDESDVALLLVSHDNIEEMQEGLNDCQVIDLEQN